MKTLAFCFCIALTVSVQAQTNLVPPPQQGRQDAAVSAEPPSDLEKSAAAALPGAALQASGLAQHNMGLGGGMQWLDAANKTSSAISYSVDAARVVGATLRGGSEGFMREGTQIVLERGVGAVADMGVGIATRSAIVGGASAVAASGALGLAYTGGSLIGGGVRDSKTVGQWLHLEKTLGHKVDDFYWNATDDRIKEAVSGTKQVDFDSPEFQRKMQVDEDRQRRRMSFERVQRENAEQQRQIQAARAAATTLAAEEDLEVNPNTQQGMTAAVLDQFNQALQSHMQVQQQRLSRSEPGFFRMSVASAHLIPRQAVTPDMTKDRTPMAAKSADSPHGTGFCARKAEPFLQLSFKGSVMNMTQTSHSTSIALFLLASLAGSAHAGAMGAENGPLSQTAKRNVNDMRAVVKQTARTHIESSAAKAMPGRFDVTSRDRRSQLASPAHDRGAVDLGVRRSANPTADAAAIARRVGPNHTTIYEQPSRGRDIHTTFSQPRHGADLRINRYSVPARATGPHIHVQPNYGIRTNKEVGDRYKAKLEAESQKVRNRTSRSEFAK